MAMARILSLKQVEERTTLKKTEIYDRIKSGTFPKQKKLTERRVVWIEGEVDAWIDRQLRENNP